jgi:glucan biosynthesis protein C
MDAKISQRRYDLDWLRVLAILAIFVFHCTRPFDTDDWGIKNATTYLFVTVWKEYAITWGMPLILLISGASAFFALGKVSPGKYIKGILARLFLPLVVGMFTHVAFQVYLENLHKGKFSGSFLDFYPHYFEGMYGFGGNFAWMGLHLWYLELLFLLSLLFLPLFWWLKHSGLGGRLLKGLGDLLAKPGAVLLFALPLMLLTNTLDPQTWGNRDLGGWSFLIYPFFFIPGFVIISSQPLQARLRGMRWISIGSGAVLSALYLFFEFQPGFVSAYAQIEMWKNMILSLSAWCWLAAIFGFGMQHLDHNTPFLKYANEAVLPFYILHQTVIISLGYFVVQWAIPDGLKFGFILVASFLVSIGLYEFLVRRYNPLRFLFGMKLLAFRPEAPVQPAHAGVARGI